MADQFSMQIYGLEETLQALTRAPQTIARKAFGKALTRAAIPVVEAVRNETPVHTGDLKEHAMSDVAVARDGSGGVAQVGFGKEGEKARYVEYGHRQVGHEPNKKDTGKYVAPEPFMRTAATVSADQAIEAFADSLQQSFDSGELDLRNP